MKIFKPFTLMFWQATIFTLSTVSFGIFVGAYWSDFFKEWAFKFLVIFVLLALYNTYVWLKQIKKD